VAKTGSARAAGWRHAATRLLLVIAFDASAHALYGADTHAATLAASDFADLTLEQLGNIVVTSVSRREEALGAAAASVYVITSEDIRRSGATSLPEALRLAPNLNIARADANQYAISARGFNNTLANRLLVLIDGRIVYSPLFSGIFWEAQDVMLPDVERIEVISGPGATLWGANAVNGVINLITRPAAATQGALVSAGAGNRDRGGAVRYGGSIGSGHFRVYGRHFDRAHTERANRSSVLDSSGRSQAGFRADWGGNGREFTLQGDVYQGDIEQLAGGSRDLGGANVLARWSEQRSDGRILRAQAYYDRVERDQPGSIREVLDVVDIEVEQGLVPAEGHQLLGAAVTVTHATGSRTWAPAWASARRAATCSGTTYSASTSGGCGRTSRSRSGSRPSTTTTRGWNGCRAHALPGHPRPGSSSGARYRAPFARPHA